MDQRIASTIEGMLQRVPGYTGYRDKENLRDDDRRVREAIASSLDETVQTLTQTNARLAEQRSFTHISTMERLIGATRLLADRLRTTSYGYGGIFTERSIDEFAIDQLRQFDIRFGSEVASLATIAMRIGGNSDGPVPADLTAYQEELIRVGKLFEGRASVVETAKPNRDAEVLALLDQNPVPPQPVAMLLHRGDALSIGNDNFIVDAIVTLTSDAGAIRLSRIGATADRKGVWLLGSTIPGQAAAKLTEVGGAGEIASDAKSAHLEIEAEDGSSRRVSAQYAYTSGVEQKVSFWYAIGDTTLTFRGEVLDDSDIVVYGKA